MQLVARMQNLTFLGRVEEAKGLEKILAAYDKESAKQNEPSLEEQRQAFINAMVENATSQHPIVR